ncbi:hypothetical protein AB4Y45_27265 [Paraburkholderia sp. EG287A]|uniref:hypothetical protein n=1 Tax=unclassified Paraburkholderia TaxID=2615204 RepID=UPI0034D278C1
MTLRGFFIGMAKSVRGAQRDLATAEGKTGEGGKNPQQPRRMAARGSVGRCAATRRLRTQRLPIFPVSGLISLANPNNAAMPNGQAMKNAVNM